MNGMRFRGWLTLCIACVAMAALTGCSVARKVERSSVEAVSAKGEMSMRVDCHVVDSLLRRVALRADSMTIVGIGHDGLPVARIEAKGVALTSVREERREVNASVADTLSAESERRSIRQVHTEAEADSPRFGGWTLWALLPAVGILIALLIKFTKNFG